MKPPPADAFINDIIRMAWADDISFDRIKRERGLSEREVILIMRRYLKPGSFKTWRERVHGRSSKHEKTVQAIPQLSLFDPDDDAS